MSGPKFNGVYPQDPGATDMMDSSRLAGVMAVFGWPDFKMPRYFSPDGKPVRCPIAPPPASWPSNFSRDQLLCLIAGYKAQGMIPEALAVRDCLTAGTLCPNGDYMEPAEVSHVQRCCEGGPTLLGDAWLKADLYFNAHVEPLSEPNQLLCMLMTAGNDFVRLWTAANPQWQKAVTDYWSTWRGLDDLAQLIIKKVSSL